ncbi:MAG: adenosylcobalamin-dependent ribonucleoside-diphosphate reductase [Candidatus Aenigmarchaeota archaeon]|nr:adenosylcobalamin-dependent ribonucleoside-diphosphate reductase [Candidatus Aenigmarchaeota archaeon]
MIEKIKKRDGKIVDFKKDKIRNAIYKATEAVGEPNFELSKMLTEEVVNKLSRKGKKIPTVEGVQDIVEQVLVNSGQSRVAKAYILYRQKRTEIREQKKQILDKEKTDEVDKNFDINALRVLRSRYLKKNEEGKVIESPKELFERVAIHVMLPSLLFDKRVRGKNQKVHKNKEFNYKNYKNNLKIGKYSLNKFHLKALRRVYDRFNENGEMKVSWKNFIKLIEDKFFDDYEKEVEEYYRIMTERKFLPNTPTIANFGSFLGMGSACFVLDIDDSIESIMDTLKRASIIFKAGGGVGYNFSKLRPEGDFVKTTGGVASGPVSFMTLFDRMTEVIKQGGIRRGANMGILNIDHPDIEKFITAKEGNKNLKNFNISVFIKENFWEYYEKNEPYPLVNPHNGKVIKKVDPKNLFDLIIYQAWESAEPGVIFDEYVNKYNPFLKTLGPITTTNPCGEVLLYPFESCNLGSINTWAFVKSEPTNDRNKKNKFDWEEFEKIIHTTTKFLDNVIEINEYPLKEIEEITLGTRKVGLGIMGLGDLLYELEIPYNSKKGLDFMERLMEFVNYHSKLESITLAKERGRFKYYEKSFYKEGRLPIDVKNGRMNWNEIKKKIKKFGIRNSFTTVIAPTGSISMIGGCSSGIEPVFSLIFEKKVSVGSFYYVDPVFEKKMMREGLFDDDLIKEVSKRNGSIQNINFIPDKIKKVFVTSMDMKAKDHIRALSSLQKWTDSSISKTINFPSSVTMKEMKETYLFAHKLGCKDLTVFRDKSIKGVLDAGANLKKTEKKEGLIPIRDDKAKGMSIYHEAGINEDKKEDNGNVCPQCGYDGVIRIEGCKKCPNCGWSACST